MNLILRLLVLGWLLSACSQTAQPSKIQPPDLKLLYQNMQQGPILSAQDRAEEQQIIQHQVQTAQGWLLDTNPKQRIAGAEQLAADRVLSLLKQKKDSSLLKQSTQRALLNLLSDLD